MPRHPSFMLILALALVLAVAGSPLRAQDTKPFVGKKPGDEWDDNSLKMKFCWCPPGKFVMGSPRYEEGRNPNEEQVFVTLSRGFWMGKYEMTQNEWQRVMGTKPSEFKGKTLPVERVSWNDATKLCKKLTELDRDQDKLPDGWEYRLPTDAQWEYACRAGPTKHCFGNGGGKLENYAWFRENSDRKTHEVGQKRPNAWGLHDMHGNVNEWCRDWYQAKLSGGTDPEMTRKATYRVVRGASFVDPARDCRSAGRGWDGPEERYRALGFRVAAVQVTK